MSELKRYAVAALLVVSMLAGCAGQRNGNNENDDAQSDNSGPQITFAREYDYSVVADYPHSTTSYTQGLECVDGVMWEGTGQEGESFLQRINLTTGAVDVVASLPDDEFGEGITHHQDRIYQLTWESHKAYVYDLQGNRLNTVSYRGEGWGLTSDGSHLYLSDGSSVIRRINPDSFATEASICVTFNGQPLDLINELEWVDGHIWANIYLTDALVEIDPTSGAVVGYVEMATLRERLVENPEAEAFNGVAYNRATGRFYVTGKDWNRVFEVEIIK